MSNKSIIGKLGNIPITYFNVILLICAIIPIVSPLGMPLTISSKVKDFYNIIDELPPGSTVGFGCGLWMSVFPQWEAADIVTMKILLEPGRDLKVIFFGTGFEGPTTLDLLIKRVNPEKIGRTYGEDYVVFGYMPESDFVIATFAEDMREIYPEDMYGTPTDDLKLMENINGIEDVDLFVIGGGVPNIEVYGRQFSVPYGTRIISCLSAGGEPAILAYYPNPLLAYIVGSDGAAQLEVLGNKPGLGSVMNDATNIVVIAMIGLIVIGNASDLVTKGKREEIK